MKSVMACILVGCSLVLDIGAGVAAEQGTAQLKFEKLQGKWVRPDGGYTITIKHAAADGQLDAAYANPNPLPFAKAKAAREATASPPQRAANRTAGCCACLATCSMRSSNRTLQPELCCCVASPRSCPAD